MIAKYIKNPITKLTLAVSLLIYAPIALAADTLYNAMNANIKTANISLPSGDPTKIIGLVIKSLLSFLGVIFFILILYGGFLWMTAQGKEDQIEKAKKIIMSSVIGVTIIFASYIITTIVFTFLEVQIVA